MHGGAIHHGYGDVSMGNSRRANDMYANMRRPDVLMHAGHHSISDQDLLNLHNNSAIPLDDNQVPFLFFLRDFSLYHLCRRISLSLRISASSYFGGN